MKAQKTEGSHNLSRFPRFRPLCLPQPNCPAQYDHIIRNHGGVRLLYASKNEEQNNAVALKEWLVENL